MQPSAIPETPKSWGASAAALIAFVIVVLAAGAIGAAFPPGAWYAGLAKPPLMPPNAVFPVVWTMLYLLIAVAGWLLWESGPWSETRLPLAAFAAQLALNALWTPLFFGLELPGAALVNIAVLWAAILTTILLARPSSPIAALLLAPYFLWVSFAIYLNAGIWWLN